MCKYKYHNKINNTDTPCQLQHYFFLLENDGILPFDDSGYCIFHSENIEWKRKNDFTDWLQKLINLLDNYDNENSGITLDGVIFVGNSLLEEQEFAHKMRTGSENELHCFMFENIFCKKSITLNNAKFEDIIIIERFCLKNDLVLQTCHFSKGISIMHFVIGGDLHIYNSHFQKRTVIANNDGTNKIYGGLYIEYSLFIGDSSFSELIINESCEINNNEFKHIENEICFNCSFLSGLKFSGNSATGLTFSSCGFYYDNLFSELKLLGKFLMYNPQISGKIKFVGNKNDLLFKPEIETIIGIDSECFEENGKITFEYCNIVNLGTTFSENYHNLKRLGKVDIGEGCRKYRICSDIIPIPSTEINHNIIVELSTSFTNYYLYSEGKNLGVEFVSKEINNLQLYYYTDEDISIEEFMSRLKKTESEYWNLSKIEKNALTAKSKKNNTFITENLLPRLSILYKISVLQSYGLWTDTDTRWLLKSISYDNDSIKETHITQIINKYIMKNIKNSIVATGQGKIEGATIKITSKEIEKENSDGITSSIVAEKEGQIKDAEVEVDTTHEKKKSFWKGVSMAVIARAIGDFIQKHLIK